MGAEVKLIEVMASYKDWNTHNNTDKKKKILTKSAITQKMTELYGKPTENPGIVFTGVRIADDEGST